MLWMGQILHLLKSLRDEELAGKPTGKAYFKKHRFSIGFSIVAGFVAYGFLFTSNQLNAAAAFTAGYMADSVVNAFTGKAIKKIEDNDNAGT
jgi:hypothetical protein